VRWYVEPAHLNNRICVIGFVRVAGKKPVLDALYNDAAEVGCSECVDKARLELSDELVAPSCTGQAKVQVRYDLGLGALVERYQS
jgi:hypothetical protein